MNKYRVIHTAGSTGKVGIFVYGPNDWAILMAMVINRVTKMKINLFKKTRLAYIGAMGGHYAGISLASSAPKFLFDFVAIDINSPLEDIIKKVNKFKPRTLSGYSSSAYLLAQEQLKGNMNIHPEKILCSGDPLSPHMQEKIVEAFGVEPTNYYASSESICMASHCDKHKYLHLFDDWHVFDFDKENLIMTTLYNYTQPLIRYEMNDTIALEEKSCDCGWSFPIIKTIAGRSEEFLWFDKKDGTRDFLHPLVLVEFFVEGLDQFQFIQKAKNKLDLHIVVHGDKDKVKEAAKKHINEILKSKDLQDDVKIDVEVVNNIKNDEKTGRFKLIVPL
jgi:phenylacetate-coenzyme A ligase PaaK-like adenylate-forming protein